MRAKQFIRKINEAAVGDGDVANAVVSEVIKLIGEGHTEVSPDVITTKVSAALGRPFMLKDLVAANNSSPELQHYIDSINPSKIKFSTDILTVKNQDPAKDKAKAETGVANMAARAASRPRLGEGIDDAAKDADYNTGHKKGLRDAKAGKPNNAKECISAQERKGYNDGYKSLNESDKRISKGDITKFHTKLDKLVHSTFGKRPDEVEEGWGHGQDRVTLPDEPATYWNGKGPLFKEYTELYDKLVPSQGPADTIEGEVLRAASKIVYRHYNDGDEFNEASFRQLEEFIGKVSSYDDLAHKATVFALAAEGEYHPNHGWDSLDVMEYGPEEYDDDDYEEDDSTWYDDDEDLEEGWKKALATGALGASMALGSPAPHAQGVDQPVATQQQVSAKQVFKNFGGSFTSPQSLLKNMPLNQITQDQLIDALGDPEAAKTIGSTTLIKYRWGVSVASVTFIVKNEIVVDAIYKPSDEASDAGRSLAGTGELTKALGAKKGSIWSTEPVKASELQSGSIDEGWESGPEERAPRERDPDAEYDDMRQRKLDAKADAENARRPQQKVYTLTGRGPNMEPNYKFPGEYDSQEAAIAAREKLMADPSTPHPEHIGIHSYTKYLDEGRETPLRDLEDYQAKKKALQDIQSDPHTSQDPELSTEVIRRLAGLKQQAKAMGLEESRKK